MKILLAILLAILLIPATVAADELWIQNEGGVEVTITGNVDSIQYDGLYAYNPENGKLAAADIKTGWIVITGDIEGYEVTLACGQDFEDVNPEVKWVKDEPVSVAPNPVDYQDYDSGPSIQEVAEPEPTPEPEPIEYDWVGQEYWLWT